MKREVTMDYTSSNGYCLKTGTVVKVVDEKRKDYIVVTKEGHYWEVPKRITKKAED